MLWSWDCHRWRCSEWINLIQWMVKKKLKFSISLFGFLEKSSSNPVTCMTSVYCVQNSTIHSTAVSVRVCIWFSLFIFFLSSRFIGGDATPLVYQRVSCLGEQTRVILQVLWGWKDPRKSPSFANPKLSLSLSHKRTPQKRAIPHLPIHYAIDHIPILRSHLHSFLPYQSPISCPDRKGTFSTTLPSPHPVRLVSVMWSWYPWIRCLFWR